MSKFFLPVRVNGDFDLLCVWTQNPYIEEFYIYQQLNKNQYSKNLVIIGDFNSNRKFDSKYVTRKERGHMPTVYELSGLGLESAYHHTTGEMQGFESKNTFYLYRHLEKGFHIDHCFLNPDHLVFYDVLDDERWLRFSDHVPLVLDVDFEKLKGSAIQG